MGHYFLKNKDLTKLGILSGFKNSYLNLNTKFRFV